MKKTTETFSINRLSELSGLDRRTIRKRLLKVKPAATVNGFPQWTVAQLQRAAKRSQRNGGVGLAEARRQKILEDVEWRRIMNEERRRVLVPAADVAEVIASIGRNLETVLGDELEAKFPEAAAGRSAPELRKLGAEFNDRICGRMFEFAQGKLTPENHESLVNKG